MRAVIVYESMYGNTQRLAEAITDALAPELETELVEVGHAPSRLDDDVDLLIVGGPTHAFSMSRPATRASAATSAPNGVISQSGGIREWLETLPHGEGRKVAVFCTKVRSRLAGSAAKAIEKQLRRNGYRLLCPPENFFVEDQLGPLQTGESGRARAWANRLRGELTRPTR